MRSAHNPVVPEGRQAQCEWPEEEHEDEAHHDANTTREVPGENHQPRPTGDDPAGAGPEVEAAGHEGAKDDVERDAVPDLLYAGHHVLHGRVTSHALPLPREVILDGSLEAVVLGHELAQGLGAAASASAVVVADVEAEFLQVV